MSCPYIQYNALIIAINDCSELNIRAIYMQYTMQYTCNIPCNIHAIYIGCSHVMDKTCDFTCHVLLTETLRTLTVLNSKINLRAYKVQQWLLCSRQYGNAFKCRQFKLQCAFTTKGVRFATYPFPLDVQGYYGQQVPSYQFPPPPHTHTHTHNGNMALTALSEVSGST